MSNDSEYVEKCLALFEEHGDVLKPKRDRAYIEARKNVKAYHAKLKARLLKIDTELANSVSETAQPAPQAPLPYERVIPDFSRDVEASFETYKAAAAPPVPETFEPELVEPQQVYAVQRQEENLDARRLRLRLMLARDDVSTETIKTLDKTKKLHIDAMGDDELTAMEEMVGVAVSKQYADGYTKKLLGGAGRIIETTAGKPPGTVVQVLEGDTLLNEDVSSLLSRYAVSSSTGVRAVGLFLLDVGTALFGRGNAE